MAVLVPHPDKRPSDEYLRAIGRVAVEWSRLEAEVESAIWQLLSLMEDRGRAVTTHIPFRPRLDILATLTHERAGDGPLYERVTDLIVKINELHADRNLIIHNTWTVYPKMATLIHHTARKKLARRFYDIPPEAIDQLADQIAVTTADLHSLWLDLRYAAPKA